MGCRYSTPEPDVSDIANAKPPAPSHPTLLEHFTKNGGTETPVIALNPGKNDKDGKPSGPLYRFRLADTLSTFKRVSTGRELGDSPFKVETEDHLKYQLCKHFPGYCGKITTMDDQTVCVMIPLYRPGRPTVKIYTRFPAFEGQSPCEKKWVKQNFGTIYAWASYRQRGFVDPGKLVTLELYEPDGTLTLAFEGRRAGLKIDRRLQLVISTVGDTPVVVADMVDGNPHDRYGDWLSWSISVAPDNVDPLLMACMAASNEMLTFAQGMAKAIQQKPHMVLSRM
jgi:hypothetical protein